MQRAITLNQSLYWKVGACSPDVRIFAPSANCNGTSGRLCVNVLLLCLIFFFFSFMTFKVKVSSLNQETSLMSKICKTLSFFVC